MSNFSKLEIGYKMVFFFVCKQQQFYAVCDCLPQNPDAVKWLAEFESTPEAWSLCDAVLHQNTNEKANFFAARVLKTKMLRSFHELPTDTHDQLRDSLVGHLKSFQGGNDVKRQLAQAVTDLALQMQGWEHPLTGST